MGFTPGRPKTGGRKPGSLNKRTERAVEILEKKNFCPIETLMEVVHEARDQYYFYRDKTSAGLYSPMEDNAAKYLKIMADSTKDLAGYVYPKLKAIEQSKPDNFAGMSMQERLEAMKQAVRFLESSIKDSEPKDPDGSGST